MHAAGWTDVGSMPHNKPATVMPRACVQQIATSTRSLVGCYGVWATVAQSMSIARDSTLTLVHWCVIILSCQTTSLHVCVCSCGRCCLSHLRSTVPTDESSNAAVDVSGLQSAVLVATPSVSSSHLSYWYDPTAHLLPFTYASHLLVNYLLTSAPGP